MARPSKRAIPAPKTNGPLARTSRPDLRDCLLADFATLKVPITAEQLDAVLARAAAVRHPSPFAKSPPRATALRQRATAFLDRVVDGAIILKIKGKSYRAHRAGKKFTNLDVVFFDTTALYFEGDGGETLGRYGHSKDHRPDLKQMVVGAVLDGEGRPICCELWPGNVTDVARQLRYLLDALGHMENWLRYPGLAELKRGDHVLLRPRFERLTDDARTVAVLILTS